MSDVKELVDQYAEENLALRQQTESLLALVRNLTFMHKDDKGVVRVPSKVIKQADKYGLEIKQLKTSTVLKVIEKTEQ